MLAASADDAADPVAIYATIATLIDAAHSPSVLRVPFVATTTPADDWR
jgi:hypothetical protein